MNQYWVYIVTNKKYGTLYTGVTSNLIQRISQHKEKAIEGFTKEYDLGCLVYFEETNSIESAILREKQIKKWNRDWKINLIERDNPNWSDLYRQIVGN